MNSNNDKQPKIYISNEGLCGRSIPISFADFKKARANANQSNNQQNQSNTNTQPKTTQTTIKK
ncbi:hypothetical protein [Helicobacter sp. 23-1045]